MSWLFEKHSTVSEKNDAIVLKRKFGRWEVRVGKYQQTGDITDDIWHNAYMRVRPALSHDPLEVLMIGLGGGGALKDIYQLFPGSTITAVEYDPTMVDIAKKLKLYAPYPEPKILLADAGEAVLSLEKKYDFIILDIFHRNMPSPLLGDEIFLKNVRGLLVSKGLLLVNVCVGKEYLEKIKTFFPHSQTWQYQINHLGSFQLE